MAKAKVFKLGDTVKAQLARGKVVNATVKSVSRHSRHWWYDLEDMDTKELYRAVKDEDCDSVVIWDSLK